MLGAKNQNLFHLVVYISLLYYQ